MKIKALPVFSVLLIGFTLSVISYKYQKHSLEGFVKAIPKKTYFVQVVIEASKIPFSTVSLSKPSFWESQKVWLESSVNIEVQTIFGKINCSVEYFSDVTTGWSCSGLDQSNSVLFFLN